MKTFKEFKNPQKEEVEINEAFFKVTIEDMTRPIFVEAKSKAEVKNAMRKRLKGPVFMGMTIKRVTEAEMKMIYRSMAKGDVPTDKDKSPEKKAEPTEESTINELSPELARKARDKAQVKRFSGKVGDKYHGQRQSDKFDSYAQRKDVEKKTGIKSPGDALKYWREHGRAPDGWGVSTDEKGKPIKAYKK